ncbi:MAG: peptidase [Armatimonadetes bacterium]|nr:peptidase [Armatimonadota bacterium]
MFAPLCAHAYIYRQAGNRCPENGWAAVSGSGQIHVHPTRRGEPEEWMYVLAHCLLHLGFGHFQEHQRAMEWNIACDCFIAKFLFDLKLGRPPGDIAHPAELPAASEEEMYRRFCENGVPEAMRRFGAAGPFGDMLPARETRRGWGSKTDWQACLGQGLVMAVTSAVNIAAGYEPASGVGNVPLTPARKARNWFINSYPLLGSLAAAFDIIEDPLVCIRMAIPVAAVDAEAGEVYMNPAAGLDEYESRFVLAHELLHVGLRHHARRQGRDPFLWNIACDFVINGWLVEMGLGELPQVGVLYDPNLKGASAESIYDRIVVDMRKWRKLCTLRGCCAPDILEPRIPDWWALTGGIDLDGFYRRCLSQGLAYQESEGRGFLPVGLVEEIRALSQPPIPWDVELAQWFNHYFAPLEERRSYARQSRRQSATPDIPRPRWVPELEAEEGRTFGVVLDTSGSMDRTLLAKALGAIASYSLSRDVPAARVIFCDAAPYDQGYMPPEAIAERVKIRGRGGTILQPGIDLLEKAEDFPAKGPVLIITDGLCDRLHIRREHAFLIPEGHHLPFQPKGSVFRIR